MKIGVIGGSGLDNPEILKNPREIAFSTRFGDPSSTVKEGEIGGKTVGLIARHGRGHTIPPTYVNNRANILALKEWGAECVLATSAVGSLREEIGRGDLVVVDQFIDFTKSRSLTLYDRFEPHCPRHTPLADPFDEKLRGLMIAGCEKLGIKHHKTGTVVTIEGSRFSTRAESKMFRMFGADVINMSTAPEAVLAAEAGLPYAVVCMSTDYDCWKTDEAPVTWDEILRIFNENAKKVVGVLTEAIGSL